MLYNILAIGDVVGGCGVSCLEHHLRAVKKLKNIHFTVVNGENAAMVGLTPNDAERIFSAGADVITLGNHTFGKMQITDYLDDCPYILRPHNLGARVPGRGYGIFDCGRARIAVMNLIGRCDLAFHADNPFKTADELLKSGESRRSRCLTSTPRRRAKSSPWPITSMAASAPSGARTPTCRRRTKRSSPRGRATSPLS